MTSNIYPILTEDSYKKIKQCTIVSNNAYEKKIEILSQDNFNLIESFYKRRKKIHTYRSTLQGKNWVSLNATKTITLTPEQVKRGKRLFINTCSICHTGGITKTNPNVGLDSEALSLATPARNTIESLVDYLKNPTTFDGLESIAEIHPSIKSADIFPKMRTLTEDDLFAIAGHILLQPKIVAEKWGGGKIYY